MDKGRVMEIFEVLKWGAYIAAAVIGWFVRILWGAQKDMMADMKKLELNLSENYTKKNDFKDVIGEMKFEFKELTQPLFKKLDRIEDFLLNNKKD